MLICNLLIFLLIPMSTALAVLRREFVGDFADSPCNLLQCLFRCFHKLCIFILEMACVLSFTKV